MNETPFLMYHSEDENVVINALIKDDTVWLTQKAMAELFNTTISNINMHIKNIYTENELTEASTIKESLIVRQEGNRTVERNIKFYNLDLIIAVGYRVKSVRGTQFRIWANKLIREYLIKGYNLNVNRFKNNGGGV